MSVPDSIRQLVERFDEHRDSYRAGKYNETQLRREFLDPFFEALGWDVFNKQGYAEAYKDIIHEDSLEVEGATKAPDYSFRIGGTRKFFVEAKKPAVNIEYDIYPAFQLRRYAWSATLSLSVLTDFEEFAVYESRSKPDKSDSAATGRVLLLNYKDYLTRWDEIAAIFSREAVLKGSFDQYAEGLKGRKGTKEVDDAFLEEIEGWRDLLARNIAIRNPDLQVRELNYAVQMTIDRIVFLRICEDRGIERQEQLQELLEGDKVYEHLCQFFRQADSRYNSGLFHFSEEKGQSSRPDDLTLRLAIDDKVLKEIIRDLYYPSPYVFREIPTEILGQVYERFLGKVIRLTAGHQAKVEEKPEVRKAGGVYYTPTYIVEYIVKNTVGKILEDKTPREAAGLKILDPACGSGSFLLGAYQYLLDWHIQWYSGHEPERWAKGKTPAIYQAQGGDYRLTTTEKKRILLNNIHGVDIDPQAVEVTKLSLSLKVLEGESQESIGAQLGLFKERALPDLGKNIQCGNSLVGPDYYEGRQLTMFINEEERYRVNAFNWKAAFPQVFSMGGFDAVIGNPPYGASFTSSDEIYFSSHYKTFSNTKDVYTCFIECALSLLKSGGRLAFIIPSGWTGGPQYLALRQVLLSYSINEIVLLPFDVFEEAYVDTLVFIITKEPLKEKHLVQTYTYPKRERITRIALQDYKAVDQNYWRGLEGNKFVLDPETIEILQHLSKSCPRKFGDVFIMRRGVLFESSLLANIQVTQDYFPYFEGDVYRYRINLVMDRWVEFCDQMKERPKEFFWFEDQRILLRRLVNRQQRLMACKTTQTFITNKNLYSIIPQDIDIQVLLGILNSRLISFLYIKQITQAVKDDFPQVTIKDIMALALPSADIITKYQNKLSNLVEHMLVLNQKSARTPQEKEMIRREIESTDRAIDALVYGLYGLTGEEIRIVEGK